HPVQYRVADLYACLAFACVGERGLRVLDAGCLRSEPAADLIQSFSPIRKTAVVIPRIGGRLASQDVAVVIGYWRLPAEQVVGELRRASKSVAALQHRHRREASSRNTMMLFGQSGGLGNPLEKSSPFCCSRVAGFRVVAAPSRVGGVG